MKTCACGCGEQLPKESFSSYINGHQKGDLVLTYDVFQKYRSYIEKVFNKRVIEHHKPSVNKTITSRCWTTKPSRGGIRTHTDRYISFSIALDRTMYRARAHILSAMIFIGEPKPGELVCHYCDRKLCCNPEHLYIGTFEDNRRDYCNRRGKETNNGHLSRHQVNTILYYIDLGEHTQDEIAFQMGCSRSTVSYLSQGLKVLTTDGSEVLGNKFIPLPFTDAKKIKRIRDMISIGIEIESSFEKRGYGSYKNVLKDFNINRKDAHICRLLAKTEINRKYYKYGVAQILRWIKSGKDLGK